MEIRISKSLAVAALSRLPISIRLLDLSNRHIRTIQNLPRAGLGKKGIKILKFLQTVFADFDFHIQGQPQGNVENVLVQDLEIGQVFVRKITPPLF